jgi:hypothetical protein
MKGDFLIWEALEGKWIAEGKRIAKRKRNAEVKLLKENC